MGIGISYMGTKRALAARVAHIVHDLPRGPFLDAFAGMSAVGEAISGRRQVWTNDVLSFPALAAGALFCSKSTPGSREHFRAALEPHYLENFAALRRQFSGYLRASTRYLRTGTLRDFRAGDTRLPFVGNDPELERQRLSREHEPSKFPFCLFTITYPGTFFGARQCFDIDSIRYAISTATENGTLTREEATWALLALARALCRINSSTGQFAQSRQPTSNNLPRLLEKRRRSIWCECLDALPHMTPVGSSQWRARNRAFHGDTLDLLDSPSMRVAPPSVVYADPPYSLAQYSRYYHLLDTLLSYHYPPVTGAGRYPPHRFQTPFSQAGAVSAALEALVSKTSRLGSALVLSYPTNGLFRKRGHSVRSLLARHYADVDIAFRLDHSHSTFGSARAARCVRVREEVFVATRPR